MQAAETINQRRLLALQQVSDEKKNVDELTAKVKALNEIQVLVQSIAADCQQRVHKQICEVVSVCLATVFSNPYKFRIHFVSKRGRTEAVAVFERNGLEVDPLEAAGGGVVDVAVFALRLACIVSSMPPLNRLIVLDEPFRHLHVDLHEKVSEMLELLATKMKCQILMTTHSSKFTKCAKVIKLNPVPRKARPKSAAKN